MLSKVAKNVWIGVSIALLVNLTLGYLSIEVLKDYGWSVFILIPILLGYIPNFYASRYHEVTLQGILANTLLCLLCAHVILLIFAIEGLICLTMAFPLTFAFAYLGGIIAYHTQNSSKRKTGKGRIISILILSLSFLGFDYSNSARQMLFVNSEVVIDAPIEKVWTNVITFDKIKEPDELIFKTGIAYPLEAKIDGNGVGAIRYCNFTTGSFVEPITTWNEPSLLQFTVEEQPSPMNELNPFHKHVHPPHLNGYFNSQKGEFRLTELENGLTKLEGTTWYYLDIHPNFYWKMWSDLIIHKIHLRVLHHIKEHSEIQK